MHHCDIVSLMFDRLHTIWGLLEGQRLRYLAALMALLVAAMLLYAVVIVPQVVLDGVLTDEIREGSLPERMGLWLLGGREFLSENLWVAAVAVVGLTLLAAIATYFRGRWVAIAAESVIQRLRDRLHDHLNCLPVTWHDQAETGDTLQRCTSDVDTLRNFLAMQIIEIGRALAMMLIPLPTDVDDGCSHDHRIGRISALHHCLITLLLWPSQDHLSG